MKKVIALILSVILLMGLLAGCSSEKDAFIGTWTATVNMAEMVNAELGDLGEMADYFTLDDFSVSMVVVFNDDDTYSVTLDRASVETAFNGLMDDLEAGVYAMLEDQFAAMGMEMSVEEILELSGMDIDSMMEQAFASMDMTSLIDSIIDDATTEGNFKVQGDKLFLSAGLEYAVDPNSYETYTLEGSTLTLVSSSDTSVTDFAMLYPIVLEKAA